MCTNRDRSRNLAVFSAVLAGITWGMSGTLAAFLPGEISSLTIGAFRLQIAGLGLLAMRLIQKKGLPSVQREIFGAVLLSGLGLAGMQVAFFTSVKLIGVGLGTMIYIGLTPLFGGLLERMLDKVPLTRRWKISVSIALLGCLLLTIINFEDMINPVGLFFALLSCLGWSLAGLAMKRVQKYRDPMETTTLAMVTGGILLLPLHLMGSMSLILEPRAFFIILLLGILTAALPYSLFNRAIQIIPAGHAFVLGMSEPLTAALLSVLVLGESFSALHLLGYALIFLGVLILSVKLSATAGESSS